jgi:hypothetical protein
MTMNGKSTKRSVKLMFAVSTTALGLCFVSGCGSGTPEDTMSPKALSSISEYEAGAKVEPKADAGVRVERKEGVDANNLKNLVASRSFSSRNDPFSLLGIETKFDQSQNAERLVQATGFMTEWEPPKEEAPEVIEPQPFRRLAGIMVGDSVLAIIDMGDGRMQIVRPGETVPGTEWTVVSIDEEKAVLRRKGNRKPKEVIVALSGSMNGIIIQPGGNQPGSSGGGPRGGPPGGMSGAPPSM